MIDRSTNRRLNNNEEQKAKDTKFNLPDKICQDFDS